MQESQENLVEEIRESTRDFVVSHRRHLRFKEKDSNRVLKSFSISEERLCLIANKLKTKSSISYQELQDLKNGLIEDVKNIETFLNIHGALRGLVRELTGRAGAVAAGCLCNVALGGRRAARAVAAQAAAYLVAAARHPLQPELAVTAAWALGNVASGGGQPAAELLAAAGAVNALAATATADTDGERAAATRYALARLCLALRDRLTAEAAVTAARAVSYECGDIEGARLLWAVSMRETLPLSRPAAPRALPHLARALTAHLGQCPNTDECCELIFLIRFLANLDEFESMLNYFIENNLCTYFKRLLSFDNDVKESTLWLLGNLFNYSSGNVFFNQLLQS